jgi:signal peptidase II
MLSGHFPDWLPIWGGEDFIFFRPVFNVADFAISLGVGIIILNQKKYFAEKISTPESESNSIQQPTVVSVKPDPDGAVGEDN